MALRKMLILRGNSAGAGSYPDETGNLNVPWPKGALHVEAAKEYARRSTFEPVVLDEPGQPQHQKSPQAEAAVTLFLKEAAVCAFYGFSGGGYNMWHILSRLAEQNPDTLHRIELVVVLGAPKRKKPAFQPVEFNAIAAKKVDPANWKPGNWDLVYRTDPPRSAMPANLPKNLDTHMFGPDVLLADKLAGKTEEW